MAGAYSIGPLRKGMYTGVKLPETVSCWPEPGIGDCARSGGMLEVPGQTVFIFENTLKSRYIYEHTLEGDFVSLCGIRARQPCARGNNMLCQSREQPSQKKPLLS
jgi:hypothetical protein